MFLRLLLSKLVVQYIVHGRKKYFSTTDKLCSEILMCPVMEWPEGDCK